MLGDAGVDYVIVGGVAANVHGALRTTLDLDIVYGRLPENVERLAAALAPCRPYLRGAPEGLPTPSRWNSRVAGVSLSPLEMLIALKRAAGRPKDCEALAELEALLEERDRQ